MLIKAYGLFWRADEIEWNPGSGNSDGFHLYGRVGKNRPTVRMADFRKQRGLYVLYDEYGPMYVGLTRRADLGARLKTHWKVDHLQGRWDRFSWFGFCAVSTACDEHGLQKVRPLNVNSFGSSEDAIGDVEAMMIWSLGPRANKNRMHFRDAECWEQVEYHECEKYLEKVAP